MILKYTQLYSHNHKDTEFIDNYKDDFTIFAIVLDIHLIIDMRLLKL